MCATDHAKFLKIFDEHHNVIIEVLMTLIRELPDVHFTLDFSTPNACCRFHRAVCDERCEGALRDSVRLRN